MILLPIPHSTAASSAGENEISQQSVEEEGDNGELDPYGVAMGDTQDD